MERRKALKLFGTASAALASGSIIPASGEVLPNSVVAEQSPNGIGNSSDQSSFTGPGIETNSGQALYSFPRDHAWHGGPFYQTNDFNEWHYITIIGRDLETGQRISVFWVPLAQGWVAQEGRPLHNVLFAYHNMDTGEFHTSMPYITGPLKTEGSAPDAKDFSFKYSIDDKKNGFTTEYNHPTETWKFSGYNTKDDKWNQPFKLDMTATLETPGYVPMAYWGLESIGVDPQDRQNPETMYGLTYYYTAPKMASKGTITLKGKTISFEGDGWFEHQWGNFRNTFQYRYFWAWFRFDNGDCISFRQYYEGEDFRNPHYKVGRYVFMDGTTYKRSYAFGPSFKVIPTKMWTSPKSGKSYPWYGRLETPQGTFYYEPTFPEQEGNALAGAYIEGVIQLRAGAPDGPIVATGFTEMISLTNPLPDGNDPSAGPAITRALPEKPELEWNPKKAKKK
jgi:predicted secreted hydrolase